MYTPIRYTPRKITRGVSLSGSSGANLRDQICERGLPLGELPSKSFVTHFWKPCSSQESSPIPKRINLVDYQSSTIEESRATVESGTTGFRTWFASRALAKYLIQNPGATIRQNLAGNSRCSNRSRRRKTCFGTRFRSRFPWNHSSKPPTARRNARFGLSKRLAD